MLSFVSSLLMLTLLPKEASSFAFTPPEGNACQSSYDQFVASEPGVYAYWPLCEQGSNIDAYDYVGQWDLALRTGGARPQRFGSGKVAGGQPGPVSDSETAARVPSASYSLESQNIPLNRNEGTIATWINSDSTDYPVTAIFLGAVFGKSAISIGTSKGSCFNGSYVDSNGNSTTTQKCGYPPDTWHRVVLTWNKSELSLYVDGVEVASRTYSGMIDNKLFYYKLFPGCCDTGKPMTLAKALVANVSWDSSQIKADFHPAITAPPSTGVYVSSEELGTIHEDVLGYADYNSDLSSSSLVAPLLTGLKASGVKSLRYASGSGGIQADLSNWRGGNSCTKTPGVTTPPRNLATKNTVDNYISQIAKPLGLHTGYTVNYGTNPPDCNAGGDPVVNGASLVQYTNIQKHYGIKYWEIGNEQFSSITEADFHPSPNTGGSYVKYEPAFYSAMKSQDGSILIGVPVGVTTYGVQTSFDLPVMAGAKYDAIIYHHYPIIDPVSDGSTVYAERVLANVRRTRGLLLTIQTELLSNGKSPDSIWVTEWDADVLGDKWSKQSMGAAMPIFVTTQLAEFMQVGVKYATWWAQGETNVCSQLNYDGTGESAYNWWECGGAFLTYTGALPGHGELHVGLRPGDLSPVGRAFQLLSQSGFIKEGEHMLRTFTDVNTAPWLQAYSATHGSSHAVILINRDPTSAHSVPVKIEDVTGGRTVQQWTYGKEQYDSSRLADWSVTPAYTTHGNWSGTFHATLPPLSVNVFVFS